MSVASLLQWDQHAVAAFFANVPRLYESAQAPVHQGYQRLLYTVEHPLAETTTDAIEAAFGLPHPAWNVGSRRDGIDLLDRAMHYPATRPIGDLRSIAGLNLTVLSHYLHFFHHAYPIYTRESCKGLERLGVAMPYTRVRDPDLYGLYIAALDVLKERIPFWCVPETNVYLTRIVQGALHAHGSEA